MKRSRTIRAVAAALFSFLIAVGASATEAAGTHAHGTRGRGRAEALGLGADAFDRAAQAVERGEIALKDAVLLKAKILFDPAAVDADPNRGVLGGATRTEEWCLTGFFGQVQQVYDQLTPEERSYLAALSEELAAIVRAREARAAGLPPTGDAAIRPAADQNKTIETAHSIVWYTTTGVDATTDAFAQLVSRYIDEAIVAETAVFRAALPERGTKLEVVVKELGQLNGANVYGYWIPVTNVAWNQYSGWIEIDIGETDMANLRATCFHEYFHGVQSAYNGVSSIWFREGSAVWAETRFAGYWDYATKVFASPSSIFNSPQTALWTDTFYKYSTVALVYYFADNYGADQFLVSYFEESSLQDDAVVILSAVLAPRNLTFFGEFRKFWVAMYRKKIPTLVAHGMPAVKFTRFNAYGKRGNGDVQQLGVRLHKLTRMTGVPSASLVYKHEHDPAVNVEAFMITSASAVPVEIPAGADYRFTARFGSDVTWAVIFYTDASYGGVGDAAPRAFSYEYLTPYIKITNTAVVPRVFPAGKTATITFTYDLLGTMAGEKFPVSLKVVEKPPEVYDSLSNEYQFDAGKARTWHFGHVTGPATPPGIKNFRVDLLVPGMSWKRKWRIPQVRSISRFWDQVTKPLAAGADAPGGDGSFDLLVPSADGL